MIFEAVITTLNDDGTPHFAPMGYRYEGPLVVIAPFRPSRTLGNLERDGQAVINLTDNVLIIAGCLTKRREWPGVAVEHIVGCRLADTLAHLEVRVRRTEADALRPRFFCEIVHQETHRPFPGFNRAKSAVVELAILITRLHLLPAEKIDSEVEYLRIAVDKTAGADEKLAWSWLIERLQQFRAGRTRGVT